MEMNQVATTQNNAPSVYTDPNAFEHAQRVCKMLITSSLVPKEYQNNMSNAMIAYEIAVRTNSSPIMVMQNIDIIQGRPSWRSTYVIAALNSCRRFSPLEFKIQDLGTITAQYKVKIGVYPNQQTEEKSITVQNIECRAYATNKSGKVIEGPPVTIKMAVEEGWYTKKDSKWPTMPQLMIQYRAAKFFGNLHAPDVLMGMQSADEVMDITDIQTVAPGNEPFSPIEILNQKVDPKPAQPDEPNNEAGQTVDEPLL